ncbi:Trigger factor [Macleaya cordata]|uniref:peptidylprolyl isomerase n=1 Tax=Macleaya cordata TaxID=56857 RepID=A0A200QKX1_MACCD|nr:Trigger factor [Macleaya cordata]
MQQIRDPQVVIERGEDMVSLGGLPPGILMVHGHHVTSSREAQSQILGGGDPREAVVNLLAGKSNFNADNVKLLILVTPLHVPHPASNGFEANDRSSFCVSALSPELEEVGVSASSFDGISVTATTTSVERELKIKVDVTGAKAEAIFDSVFSKMVADAQPIPGFRRVKGGQFSEDRIPRDVLLQVLGPSKVYKQVIKRVINSSIAEYVEKEGLKVTKDLKVEQSYEELEANFEPGTGCKQILIFDEGILEPTKHIAPGQGGEENRTHDAKEQPHVARSLLPDPHHRN